MSGTSKGDGSASGKPAAGAAPRPRKDKSSPVGRALRTVYDDTLREAVPDDFLDLLKKLD